jgi:hypothetical protein
MHYVAFSKLVWTWNSPVSKALLKQINCQTTCMNCRTSPLALMHLTKATSYIFMCGAHSPGNLLFPMCGSYIFFVPSFMGPPVNLVALRASSSFWRCSFRSSRFLRASSNLLEAVEMQNVRIALHTIQCYHTSKIWVYVHTSTSLLQRFPLSVLPALEHMTGP